MLNRRTSVVLAGNVLQLYLVADYEAGTFNYK